MERRAIEIAGVVQGVGFRPFVYGLACSLKLCGFVRNDNAGVHIEIEGDRPQIDAFLHALKTSPPPLAKIEKIICESQNARGETAFAIQHSESTTTGDARIPPDVATCDDCLKELFDLSNRRFRYPFTNCTNCGPRLTIILGSPYDRAKTTMADFAMCNDCRREYENPADRRFHAQPVACAKCGPCLSAQNGGGQIHHGDPLALTVQAIRLGAIVAIKGLGGFHLACDATNGAAVRELRKRKHRDEKPFAVMATRLDFCRADDDELKQLHSRARPIVLLRKRKPFGLVEEIAPNNPSVGVMLPYTPLHHLLMHDLEGLPLVMTSGNRSDEPIAYQNEDALERLRGIADLFLLHDRAIHIRCDDAVVHGGLIRRSRGFAPLPITLPLECPDTILAVGGQLKSTFALAHGRQATISHHLGDLDHFESFRAFERDIALYEELFNLHPKYIVHDLHPDYASTRYAKSRGLRCIAVQHHHAHMASCMAEHGITERVIGVSMDGTGYGTDGAIWGGEFLLGNYEGFERFSHLRYVPMPGGDMAIHQPWRMAMAHLHDAEVDPDFMAKRIDPAAFRAAGAMIDRDFNCPRTSSAGRLFDAVASIIGIRDVVSFEAQAAMQLEWLAGEIAECGEYPIGYENQIDTRPLIRAIAKDVADQVSPATIARRFHSSMSKLICTICAKIRDAAQINTVVLSGGVFLNRLLVSETARSLRLLGFNAYFHERIPTNDGGLSLGQILVAICALRDSSSHA